MIRAIRDRIDGASWSQSIAARNLGLTQPRVSDLHRGKISKFSLDALVEIASKLGIHVRIEDPQCSSVTTAPHIVRQRARCVHDGHGIERVACRK